MKTRKKNFTQQREMRIGNLETVLSALAHGFHSKRQIQSETGLAWGTVSGAVAQLEKSGILERSETFRTDGSAVRPESMRANNTYFYFSPKHCLSMGMEIAPDGLRSYALTPDLRTVGTCSAPFPGTADGKTIRSAIGNLFRKSLGKWKLGEESVAALTVALTGAFDREGKIWLATPHIPEIDGISLAGLEKDLSFSGMLFLEHDIVSKARSVLAEEECPPRDFVFLHIGEGVGMAVGKDGAFYEGSRGFAGEIGHIPCAGGVSREKCLCGKTGCLETRLSLRGLRTFLGKPDGIPASLLRRRAEECFSFLKPHLVQAGITAVDLFDPETLVLGGEALEPFRGRMEEAFAEIRAGSWRNGPGRFLFYRMSGCVTAKGAALGAVPRILKSAAGKA